MSPIRWPTLLTVTTLTQGWRAAGPLAGRRDAQGPGPAVVAAVADPSRGRHSARALGAACAWWRRAGERGPHVRPVRSPLLTMAMTAVPRGGVGGVASRAGSPRGGPSRRQPRCRPAGRERTGRAARRHHRRRPSSGGGGLSGEARPGPGPWPAGGRRARAQEEAEELHGAAAPGSVVRPASAVVRGASSTTGLQKAAPKQCSSASGAWCHPSRSPPPRAGPIPRPHPPRTSAAEDGEGQLPATAGPLRRWHQPKGPGPPGHRGRLSAVVVAAWPRRASSLPSRAMHQRAVRPVGQPTHRLPRWDRVPPTPGAHGGGWLEVASSGTLDR